ncbi:DUF2147 domain-containing protein [Fontimonas sp. SYSU GA230001]|uniref:DUF2147 domain-containing protein n=1 Tax=Fontimonas sp. SYSU GA230001 TaxID=3142450 RepID=UPI0032B57DDF
MAAARLLRVAAACAAAALLAHAGGARAGDDATAAFVGYWNAYEPSAGTTSTIELYRDGEFLAGRVVRITGAHGEPLDLQCTRCPPPWRGQPLAGMRFLWGLRSAGDRWVDGQVIDLRDGLTQGTVARAELERDGPQLRLHAYLGLRALGESRIWTRAKAAQDR